MGTSEGPISLASVAGQPELEAEQTVSPPSRTAGKGSAFWLSFLAIVVSTLLAALDLTAFATMLPTLADDLNGGDKFTWVGSAYVLASAAILPIVGGFSDIFGRKPVLLLAIVIFCLGSTLAGAAQNMNMMIAARTIQGLGGGAITTITQIVLSDLVPLSERGLYQGIISLVYALASGIGPILGGIFAVRATWRWMFYLNLPVAGISFGLVLLFLHVKKPEGSLNHKVVKIDWFGNLIIISGTTLAIIGLTWGGTRYPWDSAHVLAPLLIGLALIAAFINYEAHVPKFPTIPFKILNSRTTYSRYLGVFVHGITSISLIYYIPVYFQACLSASPIRSGVNTLPTALVTAPFAFVCSVIVKVTMKYRGVNVAGWVLTIIGFGLISLLRADSNTGQWVGYQILASIGTGICYAGPMFPMLAPLPISSSAYALAFYQFLRAFANTWGITISSTILQNELKKKLPDAFIAQFPAGVEIAYAAIPKIPLLPEPLQSQVKIAFADSLSTVWKTMAGISGIGVLSLLLMKEIPMDSMKDDTYGLDVKEKPSLFEDA